MCRVGWACDGGYVEVYLSGADQQGGASALQSADYQFCGRGGGGGGGSGVLPRTLTTTNPRLLMIFDSHQRSRHTASRGKGFSANYQFITGQSHSLLVPM